MHSTIRTMTPVLIAALWLTPLRGDAEEKPKDPTPEPTAAAPSIDQATHRHLLSEFGPCKTLAEARQTLEKATKALIEKGGGVIVIPSDAPEGFYPRNSVQEAFGKPAVTVVDPRGGFERIYVPPLGVGNSNGDGGGCRLIERDVTGNLPWQGVYSTENIVSRYPGGSSSFLDVITRPVKKGKDVHIYVATLRGLFAGQNLRISGEKRGYGGKGEWLTVKSLGMDKNAPYFVADATEDHPAEAIVYNKNVVNGVSVTDVTNCDNQSMSMMVSRVNYGVGDSFVYSGNLTYQGNVMSAAGDEGGLCYAADIIQDPAVFSGQVGSWDPKTQTLVYKPGAQCPQKLGTSRPIINLNPKKWVTSGKIMVVAAGYPFLREKEVKENPNFIGAPLVIGTKETNWDESLVGRFIAINEPSEYYDANEAFSFGYAGAPGQKSYRWWNIRAIEKRPDGQWNLFVERTWWWTSDRTGIEVMRFDNYSTSKDHVRELDYIIAPGSWASDVRFGVCGNLPGHIGAAYERDPRKIILAPFPQIGSKVDFEAGDPIVQPLGPCPWLPSGVRVRHHQGFPGSTLNGASYDCCNLGKVMVGAGLGIGGPGGKLDDIMKNQKDGNPSYGAGVLVGAATIAAIDITGPVRDVAIDFKQWDENIKPIRWVNPGGVCRLYGRPKNADFVFEGGNLDLGGRTTVQQRGISQTPVAAKNLRGINAAVPAGNKELQVKFEQPENDGNYAILTKCSWITIDAVKTKTAEGFTVVFETAAPEGGGRLDWFIVR